MTTSCARLFRGRFVPALLRQYDLRSRHHILLYASGHRKNQVHGWYKPFHVICATLGVVYFKVYVFCAFFDGR